MPKKKNLLPFIMIAAITIILAAAFVPAAIAEDQGGADMAIGVNSTGTADRPETDKTADAGGLKNKAAADNPGTMPTATETADRSGESGSVSAETSSTGVSDGKADHPETANNNEEEYEPGFYYTVKKGDTLWSLSKKFYDSEWEWPAMWGQNSNIRNPHLIYPGQRIRLYQKTPPIVARDKEVTPPPTPAEPKEEVRAPEPEEQPPAKKKVAVYYSYPPINKVGFIQKLPEKGFWAKEYIDPYNAGEIFKVEGDARDLLAQGDVVYIRQNGKEPFIIGNTYYIYKPPVPVKHPVTEEYVGHQYLIAGIAEVTATPPGYIVAKITHSFREIGVGDRLMPLDKRPREIEVKDAPNGINCTIICSEDHNEIFGDNTIVFIDKGAKDGIQPGQKLEIYYRQTGELNGNEMKLQPVVYGDLFVLLTRKTTSTAVITRCYKSVQPGASCRTMPAAPGDSS